MGLALFAVALAICALCGAVVMSHAGSSELLEVRHDSKPRPVEGGACARLRQRVLTLDAFQVRMPNGMIAEVVPVQALQQRRMQKLFGPGDLPIPIEGDGLPGGDAHVVPGNFALPSLLPYLSYVSDGAQLRAQLCATHPVTPVQGRDARGRERTIEAGTNAISDDRLQRSPV